MRIHTTPVYKIEYGPTISKELTDDIVNIVYKYDGYVSEDKCNLSISKIDLAYEYDHIPPGDLRDTLKTILDNSDPDNTDCYLEIF